jgi:acetylornithine deacetylase/succinyl-diaminopimelate desuccinylase-like protein
MTPRTLALLILALPIVVFTQANPASQAARQWRQQHEHAIVDEYVAFLKIPNLSKDSANIQRNADALVDMMAHPRVALVTIRPGGYTGGRTPMDLLISQDVIRVVESARGPAIKIPSSGGAIPLTMIDNALGTRTIVMPIANHDDNQHAFDENLRLQNLWDGIELMAALLTM